MSLFAPVRAIKAATVGDVLQMEDIVTRSKIVMGLVAHTGIKTAEAWKIVNEGFKSGANKHWGNFSPEDQSRIENTSHRGDFLAAPAAGEPNPTMTVANLLTGEASAKMFGAVEAIVSGLRITPKVAQQIADAAFTAEPRNFRNDYLTPEDRGRLEAHLQRPVRLLPAAQQYNP